MRDPLTCVLRLLTTVLRWQRPLFSDEEFGVQEVTCCWGGETNSLNPGILASNPSPSPRVLGVELPWLCRWRLQNVNNLCGEKETTEKKKKLTSLFPPYLWNNLSIVIL